METPEKLMMVDEDTGASIWALTLQWLGPRPAHHLPRGRHGRTDPEEPPADSMMEAQHRLSRLDGRAPAVAASRMSTRAREVVLRWKATKAGCFNLSLARPGGAMIPYHVLPRHERRNHGAAARRAEGRGRQPAAVRQHRLFRRAGTTTCRATRNGDYRFYDTAGDDYTDSLDAMATLTPTHQVFNGAVGALTGDGALKAKVGETVLMVHNSCNVDSRPHLIGRPR